MSRGASLKEMMVTTERWAEKLVKCIHEFLSPFVSNSPYIFIPLSKQKPTEKTSHKNPAAHLPTRENYRQPFSFVPEASFPPGQEVPTPLTYQILSPAGLPSFHKQCYSPILNEEGNPSPDLPLPCQLLNIFLLLCVAKL